MDMIGRIEVVRADLTKEKVGAIVNAANAHLANGGGVAGAISRAAGPDFQRACDELVAERGPLPVGGAAATESFDLPCQKVIHTVGPVYGQHGGREADLLAAAHRNAIVLAAELDLDSIAFPAISCGIFGYPVEEAAPVALSAALESLEQHPLGQVRFCFIGDAELTVFRQTLKRLTG